VILVVDNNPDLFARARRELSGTTVLENDDVPGLSGARNTGLRAAKEPVTVFLDDDAEAREGWLAGLLDPYQRADVVATGGSVHPCWPELRPRWFPATFDWVVGCSYTGLPESVEAIRNPIGANMSMRTDLALQAGGFDPSVGRVRGKPRGCEETELAIRLTANSPGSRILYVPGAAVDHHVAADRVSVKYFVRRCWNEGLSKATVVRLAGSGPGLERERRQVRVVIPTDLLGNLRRFVKGDLGGGARIAVASGGLMATMAGYLAGRIILVAR
jgi:GT2 family glycosyltransferase